eukprot:PLAT12429.1.p1 GENE.PLAT12429.1~~PLAT12429.1.p1  ORF type:complete len:351 (+),score=49.44 PLAT12429.1:61-1113(+)
MESDLELEDLDTRLSPPTLPATPPGSTTAVAGDESGDDEEESESWGGKDELKPLTRTFSSRRSQVKDRELDIEARRSWIGHSAARQLLSDSELAALDAEASAPAASPPPRPALTARTVARRAAAGRGSRPDAGTASPRDVELGSTVDADEAADEAEQELTSTADMVSIDARVSLLRYRAGLRIVKYGTALRNIVTLQMLLDLMYLLTSSPWSLAFTVINVYGMWAVRRSDITGLRLFTVMTLLHAAWAAVVLSTEMESTDELALLLVFFLAIRLLLHMLTAALSLITAGMLLESGIPASRRGYIYDDIRRTFNPEVDFGMEMSPRPSTARQLGVLVRDMTDGKPSLKGGK